MRILVVCLAALLLSGCAWGVGASLHRLPPPVASTVGLKPEAVRPHKPHGEPSAPQVQTAAPAQPVAAPPAPDYSARCHAMAGNRADDAASTRRRAADQAKVQSDTYRDCMAQSVKPTQ